MSQFLAGQGGLAAVDYRSPHQLAFAPHFRQCRARNTEALARC